MILSMNWIGDFVDLSGLDKRALIQRFTLSTAEVEDIIEKGADTYGVIVAKIVSVKNHPSSKKLHLLKVDTGRGIVDCVCGAPNVKAGVLVPVALDGAKLPGGVKIKKGKMRGEVSNGMLCSGPELDVPAGLYPHIGDEGIIEIFEEVAPGTDVKEGDRIESFVMEEIKE